MDARTRRNAPWKTPSLTLNHECTHDGRTLRALNIGDEYKLECVGPRVKRKISHQDVLETLTELFCERDVPVHLRSDNRPGFTARKVRELLDRLAVKPLFIEAGSPWENGYIESFNGKMRDELLNREIFYTVKEAQILIE